MAWQIGVDVGGTFTDLLALDPERGSFRVAKVPSTPEDQSVGFIAGLSVLETDLAAVAALVHGTTVATNAVLERKGARCGLITTAGFRDVLELGRRTRPNPYGMTGSFEALIPRDLRSEVAELIDAAGRVLTPLDAAAVRQEVHRLREHGAESIVNAANCWGPDLCAKLGMKVPVAPMRRLTFYFRNPGEARADAADPAHRPQCQLRPQRAGYISGNTRYDEPPGFNWEVDYPYFDEAIWPGLAAWVERVVAARPLSDPRFVAARLPPHRRGHATARRDGRKPERGSRVASSKRQSN